MTFAVINKRAETPSARLTLEVIVLAFPSFVYRTSLVTVLDQCVNTLNGMGNSLCCNFFTSEFIEETIGDT